MKRYNGDELSVCAGRAVLIRKTIGKTRSLLAVRRTDVVTHFLRMKESPFDKAQILEGAPTGFERVNNHPRWRSNNSSGLMLSQRQNR